VWGTGEVSIEIEGVGVGDLVRVGEEDDVIVVESAQTLAQQAPLLIFVGPVVLLDLGRILKAWCVQPTNQFRAIIKKFKMQPVVFEAGRLGRRTLPEGHVADLGPEPLEPVARLPKVEPTWE
jgi:hypothetical protein